MPSKRDLKDRVLELEKRSNESYTKSLAAEKRTNAVIGAALKEATNLDLVNELLRRPGNSCDDVPQGFCRGCWIFPDKTTIKVTLK